MEISKLTDARRNLEKMKNIQREVERDFSEIDRRIQNMGNILEETNRYLNDAESELRRIENK